MIKWLRVREASAVAEARRRIRRLAIGLGFDLENTERMAIVASEAATNILRHAGRGNILIQRMPVFDRARIAMVAVDEGPGIGNLDRMMRDGESRLSSTGTGLGAMRRLSDRFDIHTVAGAGTVVACEFRKPGDRAVKTLEVAALLLAHPLEPVCGDAWSVSAHEGTTHLLLCDGLGHGAAAAEAANLALTTFKRLPEGPVAGMFAALAADLSGTRGSVAALCRIDEGGRRMSHCGLGNITTLIASANGVKRMPVRDGQLGGPARSPLVTDTDLVPGNVIIMHTDGLATLRNLETRPELLRRSSLAIAGTLLRDDLRGRDDAGVIVARVRAA